MPRWASRSRKRAPTTRTARAASLQLEINDTGGAQGLLALAAWANVEEEREWQGGYEQDYRADGRMIHERWDCDERAAANTA